MRIPVVALMIGASVGAAQGPSFGARLPIREVTLFKDGHAFIFHEGQVATDTAGQASIDQVPMPVLGTFWAYAVTPAVKLTAVTAGQRPVASELPVSGLVGLIEANQGAQVTIRADSLHQIQGVLLGFSAGNGAAAGGPPNRDWVLVRTSEGTRLVSLARIAEIQFKDEPRRLVQGTVLQRRLTMHLDWGAARPTAEVGLGLAYLQYGLKWTPSYRIELDGKGLATVFLQATIANDVADLVGVTARLVIGVPSFAMRSQLDPMALQETLATVEAFSARYGNQGGRTANLLRGQFGGYRGNDEGSATEPAELESGRTEDLFVFTVPNLTLKMGDRITVPVAKYDVKYSDIYALTVYHAAPRDLEAHLGAEQAQLARMLARPTVIHRIRLANQTGNPFTTAPALILRGAQILAQGLMTYTAPGGSADLDVTKAVDIQIDKQEAELRRTPSATRWHGSDFSQVDLSGSLTLTNRREVPLEIEVTRYLLGQVDSTSAGARRTRVNLLEDEEYLAPQYASWWSWYSFPGWWQTLNGVTRLDWKIRLAPGAKQELRFRWHYFWNG